MTWRFGEERDCRYAICHYPPANYHLHHVRAPTSDTDFCGASPFLRFLNEGFCVTCGSTQRTPYQLLRSFLSVGKSCGFDIFRCGRVVVVDDVVGKEVYGSSV